MGAGFAAPAASHVHSVAVARTGGTLERGGVIALRSTFDARFGIIGLNFGFCLVTTWSLTKTNCHVMQLDMLKNSVQPNVKLSFGEGGSRLVAAVWY